MKRRQFIRKAIQGSALLAGLPAVIDRLAGAPPSERIGVAVAGIRGRGNNLLRTFAAIDEVEVRYLIDIDAGVLRERNDEIVKETRHRPQAIADFRRALDDRGIDALVLGTPDHWHAIPTILACQAGKDVYTEKPDGHNILESHTMVAAARRHQRVVQLGTQSRSAAPHLETIDWIRKGNLGKVRRALAWESARQADLGRPPDGEPPAGVDYDFWLGPAPKRPFNPLRFHGNWRWFFDYGTGDVGNDGVHRLDYARWGLEAALEAQGEKLPRFPRAVSAHGGKYYFDDAQEWPDTLHVDYDYGNCLLGYEMRLWCPQPIHGVGEGAVVYGDKGYAVLSNGPCRVHGADGKVIFEKDGRNLDATDQHARNFLACMRNRGRPAADLETVGHISSLLCHVGNVAWRVGRTVRYDLEKRTFPGDAEANRFLTRSEYRKPWELPRIVEG
jgi:predicted dehydrogenase